MLSKERRDKLRRLLGRGIVEEVDAAEMRALLDAADRAEALAAENKRLRGEPTNPSGSIIKDLKALAEAAGGACYGVDSQEFVDELRGNGVAIAARRARAEAYRECEGIAKGFNDPQGKAGRCAAIADWVADAIAARRKELEGEHDPK